MPPPAMHTPPSEAPGACALCDLCVLVPDQEDLLSILFRKLGALIIGQNKRLDRIAIHHRITRREDRLSLRTKYRRQLGLIPCPGGVH